MPKLVEVSLSLGEADLPDRAPITVALTATGHFGYEVPESPDTIAVFFDSLGRRIAGWGRRGQGPGEARRGFLLGGDSAFIFVASDPPSALMVGAHGDLITQRPGPFHDGLPLAVHGDSLDRSLGQRIVGLRGVIEDVKGPIVRTCLRTECTVQLLAADNPVLRAVQEATPRREGVRWPPYAAESGRVVIGDGVNYRLWYFDQGGRLLAAFTRELPRRSRTPRERRADEEAWASLQATGVRVDVTERRRLAESEPLPHFGYGSLGFDAAHRLWVLGKTGDSTFADVFEDTTFLGRQMIDCLRPDRGAVGIRGRHIVLTCADTASIEVPFRLRLFKIIDSE